MPTLDLLAEGQRARVDSIGGEPGIVQRLYEMGLFEGEECEVVGFAPLGDPMEIRLKDYRLSLRRREAALVQVTLLSEISPAALAPPSGSTAIEAHGGSSQSYRSPGR